MLFWEKSVWSRPVPQRTTGFRLSQFICAFFVANEATILTANAHGKPGRNGAKFVLATMGIEHAPVYRDEFGSIAGLDGGDKSTGDREWNYQRHDSGRGPIQFVSASMALSQFV